MNITAAMAFSLFMEINSASTVTASTVYWEALDAERDGVISVGEMDAIAIYHKAYIVTAYAQEMAWREAEEKEMAEVDKAMDDYWADYESSNDEW